MSFIRRSMLSSVHPVARPGHRLAMSASSGDEAMLAQSLATDITRFG
jgi:hypothetical protein